MKKGVFFLLSWLAVSMSTASASLICEDKLAFPKTSLQLAASLQRHYHTLRQHSNIQETWLWIESLQKQGTWISQESKRLLAGMQSSLLKLASAPEKNWPDFSKQWLSSLTIIIQTEGRAQARSAHENRLEHVRIQHEIDMEQARNEHQQQFELDRAQKKASAYERLIKIFKDERRCPHSIEKLLPYLIEARAALVQLETLSMDSKRIVRAKIIVDDFMATIPRLQHRPIREATTRKVWKHFKNLTEQLDSSSKQDNLSIEKLAEHEWSEWLEETPVNVLADVKKWFNGARSRFEWKLDEKGIDRNSAQRREFEEFSKKFLQQLNAFLETGHLASKESSAQIRDFVVAQMKSLQKDASARLDMQIPQLVRVAKEKDPGDDPYLEVFRFYIHDFSPVMFATSVNSAGVKMILEFNNSILHWIGRLPIDAKVQDKAKSISKEAGDDIAGAKFKSALALELMLGRKSQSTMAETWQSYIHYYENQMAELRQMLPPQTYSGTTIPSNERLVRALGVLQHYIQYLKEGEFEQTNAMEFMIMGRVVLRQFSYAQEFLKSEAAKQITEQMSDVFSLYVEKVGKWIEERNDAKIQKEDVLNAMELLLDRLEIVLSLEDETYQRNSKPARKATQKQRDQGNMAWTDKPLTYEQWLKVVPNKIVKMSEAERSLQWALYVFQLDEQPTVEIRKEYFKTLAKQFHPDRGGSLDSMKNVNAANDILKLYE